MKYLIRRKKNNELGKIAHLWNGEDTYCRMASTNGLNIRNYKVFGSSMGKSICQMCVNKNIKQ